MFQKRLKAVTHDSLVGQMECQTDLPALCCKLFAIYSEISEVVTGTSHRAHTNAEKFEKYDLRIPFFPPSLSLSLPLSLSLSLSPMNGLHAA